VRDSSDDEWENSARSANLRTSVPLDSNINTRDMVDNAFIEEPLPADVEDVVHDVVTAAFELGDSVHRECMETSVEEEGPNLTNDGDTPEDDFDAHEQTEGFDPSMLEDAIQELYAGSRTTKLAATILVMNLCTVHGISNNFADELFIILHGRLLPERNSLPRNHYATKTLTSNLGLAYKSIHACVKECVLFKGKYADAKVCPKCGTSRFSDPEHKKFPVKVLRHFSIISQL
jgi:hypothetical protein